MSSDIDSNVDYTSLLHMVFIAASVLILIIQFIFFSVNTDILERQIHSLMGRITNLEAVFEEGQDDTQDDTQEDAQDDTQEDAQDDARDAQEDASVEVPATEYKEE